MSEEALTRSEKIGCHMENENFIVRIHIFQTFQSFFVFVRDLKEDSSIARRRVERDKSMAPIWKTFVTNTNKFGQVRNT